MSEHTNRGKTVPITQCPACSALCDRATCPLHAAAPKLLTTLKALRMAIVGAVAGGTEGSHETWAYLEALSNEACEAVREAKGEA